MTHFQALGNYLKPKDSTTEDTSDTSDTSDIPTYISNLDGLIRPHICRRTKSTAQRQGNMNDAGAQIELLYGVYLK